MRKRTFIGLVIFASILIGACSEQETDTGINWYAGTVDEAFAAAKTENKPVYLYWGAKWCPPCHAIAATVFKSKSFIDRSRSFIAVYLDGDADDAQAMGERFNVLGYPTMIIFDPSGTELTRIPGGMDMQAYATVLDLALDDVAPAAEIVARVVAGGEALEEADCRLLAYYSWGQDREILKEHDAASVFEKLESACPSELAIEKSILYMAQLGHRMELAEDEENPQPLTGDQKVQALQRVNEILNDYAMVKANIFDVAFGSADITAALTESTSPERRQLQSSFLAVLDQLMADDDVYMRERLYTLIGKINFERIDDADVDISELLKEEIRTKVVWADEITTNPYERLPVINAAANVLGEAGMDEIAKPLLLAEIEHSKQPYYFMLTLADIEQTAGNIDGALEWLKRAYDASAGPATRFQWGYYYVSGLIEMAPEDAETIGNATVTLVRDIVNNGGFFQRPKAQLKRLESKLQAWIIDDDVLADIRDQVRSICAPESACENFLADSEAPS